MLTVWCTCWSALAACERTPPPPPKTAPPTTTPSSAAVSLPSLERRAPSLPKTKQDQEPIGTLTVSTEEPPAPILRASTLSCHEGTLLQLHTSRGAQKPPLTTSLLFPTTQLPSPSDTSTIEEISRTPRQLNVSSPDPDHVLLSTSQPPLQFTLSREGYASLPHEATIDHGLGAAGCFHTGRFSLKRGDVTLLDAHSAFAFHTPTKEVYTLVHEIDERTAISILLYLPSHLIETTLPLEVDLAKVFSDPGANTVRAFIKARSHRPKAPHHLTWSARPIEQGTLRITRPDDAKPLPLQATSIPQLHVELLNLDTSAYPELSRVPQTSPPAPLSLEARHSIIPNGQEKFIPAPIK